MLTVITPEEVEKVLRDTRGGFFTVIFMKRTTREMRTMRATLNYKGELKGGDPAYDHASKKLLVVRDMDATRKGDDAIRSIPWDAVYEIRANNNVYVIKDTNE